MTNPLLLSARQVHFNESRKLAYKITLMFFFIAFTTITFGHFVFGIELPTDISTFIIYFIFFVLLVSSSLHFSRLLIFTWLYIFIQTFILNWSYINFKSSLNHFLGFILFSVVCFSFISNYRHKIISIIMVYYKFCFFIACLAIFQTVLFLIFNLSFLPQTIISGPQAFGGNTAFVPEFFGIFPRAVGFSSEPSHYVAILLPALYISLNVLSGTGNLFNIYNKKMAVIILLGFIISFSIVGYFGLALCVFFIFRRKIKTNFFKTSLVVFGFAALCYMIIQSPTSGGKIDSFISRSNDITEAQYTSSDNTSFALLSNLMVATEGLKISQLLGTGFNSHEITYDATILKIFDFSQIPNLLNKKDAASLFLRIPSELGLPGLVAFIIFLIHFKVRTRDFMTQNGAINSMCLAFLIMYSSRNGNYLDIQFIFFASIYYYTYILNKKEYKNLNINVLK